MAALLAPLCCTRKVSTAASLGRRNLSMASIQATYLSAMTSYPVTATANALCETHDWLGWGWGAVIPAVALVTRIAVMAPAHVVSQKTIAKRRLLWLEMDQIVIPNLRQMIGEQQRAKGWSDATAKQNFNRVRNTLRDDMIIKRNCAATKMFMPLMLQIPVWLCMSFAVRQLSSERWMQLSSEIISRFPQMQADSFLWLSDLTAPDGTFVLPVLIGLGFLLNTELAAHRHTKDVLRPTLSKVVNNFLRLLAVAMVPLASTVPSVLALFWMTSTWFGLALNLSLMSPRVRRLVRIPRTPEEPAHPYRQIWENVCHKTSQFRYRIGLTKQ